MVIDWALLSRYLAGLGNDEERRQVEQWLTEAPEHRAVLEGARQLIEQARREVPAERTAALLASLRREIDGPSVGVGKSPLRVVRSEARLPLVLPLVPRPAHRWRRIGVAAAGLAALAAGVVTWARLHSRNDPRASTSVARQEFVTVRGQRLTLRLPDGSSVVLGPASRLRVLEGYNVRERSIVLAGEGTFTVAHDARRPFSVYTAHGVAKDLGTRFNVSGYAEDSSTTVVVAEGAVDLRGAGRGGAGVTLRPGQLGRVDGTGAVDVQRGVDLEQYFSWTEGRLVFRDTPLRDAAAQLARWYDVEIRLASPALAQRHLTASAQNDSPADVLAMIAVSLKLDLDVSGAGRVFTLRAR